MPLNELDISDEDWRRDRRLVLSELTRIGNKLDTIDGRINSDVTDMKVEVATLKTKVALYAALVGGGTGIIISIITAVIINVITKR